MANEKTPLLKSAKPILTTAALGDSQTKVKPGYTMSYQGMMIHMSMDQREHISSDDAEQSNNTDSTTYLGYLRSVYSYGAYYGVRGLGLFTTCLPYFTSTRESVLDAPEPYITDEFERAEGASLLRNPSNKAELFEYAESQWFDCVQLKAKYNKMYRESNLGWTRMEEIELINHHNELARDCYFLMKQAADAGREQAVEFLEIYFKLGPDTNEMSPKPPVFGI